MRTIAIWSNLVLITSVWGIKIQSNTKNIPNIPNTLSYCPSVPSNQNSKLMFSNSNSSIGEKPLAPTKFDEYELIANIKSSLFIQKMKKLKKDVFLVKNLASSKSSPLKTTNKKVLQADEIALLCNNPFKCIDVSTNSKKATDKVVLIQHNRKQNEHSIEYIREIAESINRRKTDLFDLQCRIRSIINIMFFCILKKERLDLRIDIFSDILNQPDLHKTNIFSLNLDEKISKIIYIVSFQYNRDKDIKEMMEVIEKDTEVIKREIFDKEIDIYQLTGEDKIKKQNSINKLLEINNANMEFISCMYLEKAKMKVDSNKTESTVRKITKTTIFKLLKSLIDPAIIKTDIVKEVVNDVLFQIGNELYNLEVMSVSPSHLNYKNFDEMIGKTKETILNTLFSIAPEYTIYNGLPELEKTLRNKSEKFLNAAVGMHIYLLQYIIDDTLDKLIHKEIYSLESLGFLNRLDALLEIDSKFIDFVSNINKLVSTYNINPAKPAKKHVFLTQSKQLKSLGNPSLRLAIRLYENKITSELFQNVYKTALLLKDAHNLSILLKLHNEVWDNLAFYYSEFCIDCQKYNTFVVFKSEEKDNRIYRKILESDETHSTLKAFYKAKTSYDIENIEGPCEEFFIDDLLKTKEASKFVFSKPNPKKPPCKPNPKKFFPTFHTKPPASTINHLKKVYRNFKGIFST